MNGNKEHLEEEIDKQAQDEADTLFKAIWLNTTLTFFAVIGMVVATVNILAFSFVVNKTIFIGQLFFTMMILFGGTVMYYGWHKKIRPYLK